MEKETTLLLILIILLIVLYYFSTCKPESFDNTATKPTNLANLAETKNTNEPVVLLVFLTKQCPHCHHYDKDVHHKLSSDLKKHNVIVKKIYADEDDDDLFDKHEIMYVPAGVVKTGDSVKKVNGALTAENVMKTSKQ